MKKEYIYDWLLSAKWRNEVKPIATIDDILRWQEQEEAEVGADTITYYLTK